MPRFTPYAAWLWWQAAHLGQPLNFETLAPDVAEDVAYICRTEIPESASHLFEMRQALNTLAEAKKASG